MHTTAEVCSNHHNHHSTLLGQLWDTVSHRLAVLENQYAFKEELLRREKEFQLRKMSQRSADIQRMLLKIF
ncbi:MAG: hypothetical protein ACXAE3_06115 [Candidatus Kariarchaeaceae archaeon]|jgi:hypothetical protein